MVSDSDSDSDDDDDETAGAIVGGWGNLGSGLPRIAMVRTREMCYAPPAARTRDGTRKRLLSKLLFYFYSVYYKSSLRVKARETSRASL